MAALFLSFKRNFIQQSSKIKIHVIFSLSNLENGYESFYISFQSILKTQKFYIRSNQRSRARALKWWPFKKSFKWIVIYAFLKKYAFWTIWMKFTQSSNVDATNFAIFHIASQSTKTFMLFQNESSSMHFWNSVLELYWKYTQRRNCSYVMLKYKFWFKFKFIFQNKNGMVWKCFFAHW